MSDNAQRMPRRPRGHVGLGASDATLEWGVTHVLASEARMATVDNTAISRPRAVDLIPGYRLDKLVGKGGMGEVYRATQLSLDRPVAVKLLSPELAKDATFVARFEKEAAALAQLSHPSIVSILEKGTTDGVSRGTPNYYLVMEFVDGGSLREVMRQPPLDSGSAAKVLYDICRAIDYAHNRGVIHRDLKPENILFDDQAGKIPKVSDFGLAAFSDEHSRKFNVTETHVAMGTTSYMAPEQRVDAKSADHRADIYSLGIIFYELLVGEIPVGNYDPPSVKRPGLDKRVDDIVARCLKPLPADRYSRVAELMTDLEPLVPMSFSAVRHPTSRVERMLFSLRRFGRQAARVANIVVVLLALGVLAVSYVRTRNGIQRLPNRALAEKALTYENTVTLGGRIDQTALGRNIVVGEGPDPVTFKAFGRPVLTRDTRLVIESPLDKTSTGYAFAALELEGDALKSSAKVQAVMPPPGALAWLKSLWTPTAYQPRAGLMWLGPAGEYVALIAPADGSPLSLEWALGERRGAMLGTALPNVAGEVLTLTLNADGELRALFGEGADERPVAEPVMLGKDWKRLFGDRVPRSALGCLEANCEFAQVSVAVLRTPPPPLVETPEPTPELLPNTTAKKPSNPLSAVRKPTAAKTPPRRRR